MSVIDNVIATNIFVFTKNHFIYQTFDFSFYFVSNNLMESPFEYIRVSTESKCKSS